MNTLALVIGYAILIVSMAIGIFVVGAVVGDRVENWLERWWKERKLKRVMRTPEGTAAIGKAMRDPLKARMDRQDIDAATFPFFVDGPDGAVALQGDKPIAEAKAELWEKK